LRKYKQGEPINSISELMDVLDVYGVVWVLHNRWPRQGGKSLSRAFIEHMPFKTVASYVRDERLFKVKET